MSKTVRRRGFTLPEVLVTITIVAVLAAVVVPAVLNQVNKGDSAALAGDVGALRTAISNFTTDTRHYPKSIKDLVKVIDKDSLDLMGNVYGAGAAAAWKGPYFPTSQDVTTGTTTFPAYTTAYNSLTIANMFEAPATGNANFITLVFSSPTPTVVAQLDRIFDGGTGLVPAATCASVPAATGASLGNIRWTETDGTPCAISNLKWRLVSAAQ